MRILSAQEVSIGQEKIFQLNEHVGRKYMFALIQGRTTPAVDIHPFIFNFKEAYF